MAINRIFYVSKKKVLNAGEFIMEYGREIDKILYLHYFGEEPTSSVVSVLERYCKEDGGAGGLEPDMLYEGSTPISCSLFFSYLNQIKVTAEFGAIQSVLEYLYNNIQKNKSWRPIVPEVSGYPRASWWNYDVTLQNEYFFNPTCEIIGYFYHYGGGDYRAFSKDLMDVLYDELVRKFVGTLQMHDVISLMQLCRLIPDVAAERFIGILKSHMNEMVVTDNTKWTDYVMSPLSVFKTPLDPLYYDFEKAIDLNLDYEISRQTEEGVWLPNWHWGQFEGEFDKKFNEITANVTINKLIQLKNFNRITRLV